ncbi:hypothetical protein OEZ85_002987 [Tetradesmus obliquus]|uniref:C2H2-type domain-containing protein n=1 Tax=Tetradesmus obliquus TaxID=3088 RepID=A0ABY8U1Y6_TETOB|nr:hypothetical protein OEZ85_002987 [Tetradesmus obliquus]
MTEPLPVMTEPQLEAPKSLRYTCPYPGCTRSFRDFWRLKVHYRAPPNARGSGVERGHGMELPFCPLCNLDLRDVKYHKCAAGPAAAAPARSRNNQAGSTVPRVMPNSTGPFSMMMHPGGMMMPFNGMPGMNGHSAPACRSSSSSSRVSSAVL